jgi:APA family basic amino acid/polyamine antiporter
MSPSNVSLERRLGSTDGAAIVISNVIGIGIFTTPGIVAELVPHPVAMLGVWMLGGLLAFAGATAYAELASRMPRAGGEYVYLRESYGPLAAFLTGWISFVAGFSGAIAAGAVGLSEYLGRFAPALADSRPLAIVPLGLVDLEISRRAIVAIAVILGLAWIHVRGLRLGRLLQNSLAATKVAALGGFILLGLIFGQGSVAHFVEGAPATAGSWIFALIPVMFSYSGWNAATYVAEEIRDPVRNVPRALAMGTGVVVLIYLGLNALYLYTFSITGFRGIAVGELAAERTLGAVGAVVLSGLTIFIILGSMSAMILVGPRIYYAMARDGLFFQAATHVHARYRSPAVAIIAQALWSAVLVLSGSFEQLLTYTGFTVVLFAGLAVTSLFVLRRTRPDQESPFRAWGYPIAPALFSLASLLIVANAIREQPAVCAAGLLVIVAGIPVYGLLRRSRSVGPH